MNKIRCDLKIISLIFVFLLIFSFSAMAELDEARFRRDVVEGLENREGVIELSYPVSISNVDIDELKEQFRIAMSEADEYTAYTTRSWEIGLSGSSGNVDITINVVYLNTIAEDEYVFREVEQKARNLFNFGDDRHDKLKKLTDYIATNVVYDHSKTYYSAYDALRRGTATCQGYALLTHLFLEEAGLENIIISGTLDNEKHGWNLVKVGGNWYHLDLTQISGNYQDHGELVYDEYMVFDSAISLTHSWDISDYPSAPGDYGRELRFLSEQRRRQLKEELRIHLLDDEFSAFSISEIEDRLTEILKEEREEALLRVGPDINSTDLIQEAMNNVMEAGEVGRNLTGWNFSKSSRYLRDGIRGSSVVYFKFSYR